MTRDMERVQIALLQHAPLVRRRRTRADRLCWLLAAALVLAAARYLS